MLCCGALRCVVLWHLSISFIHTLYEYIDTVYIEYRPCALCSSVLGKAQALEAQGWERYGKAEGK